MIAETLGPYHVLAKLGEGGMGEVYKARDPRLGREVAIKVLPAGFAGDEKQQRIGSGLAALHSARSDPASPDA